MEIGTAKPTEEEQSIVPHHLIDFVPVTQNYNAGQFERDALACIERLFKKHKVLILSGGSGLYIKAVCEGIDEVPSDEKIREELTQRFNEEGLEPLQKELEEKDPDYFEQVDKANPHRVMRALEVIRATGKTYSSFRQGNVKKRDFQIIKIGLDRDREKLYERINLRVDLMLEQGLLKEVTDLHQFKTFSALQTVGYQEIFDFLDHKHDWEEAVRLIKRNSRRYAKRQMTWFRKDADIHWFSPDQLDEITTFVTEQLPK